MIVIDNGSSDGSVEMVRQEFPNVRLQVNGYNERFAKPNNDGMRQSGGRYLFFLNSDAVISEGTLGAPLLIHGSSHGSGRLWPPFGIS